MSNSNETTDLWTMVAEGNKTGRKARVTGKLYSAILVGIFGAAAVVSIAIIAASKGKF